MAGCAFGVVRTLIEWWRIVHDTMRQAVQLAPAAHAGVHGFMWQQQTLLASPDQAAAPTGAAPGHCHNGSNPAVQPLQPSSSTPGTP